MGKKREMGFRIKNPYHFAESFRHQKVYSVLINFWCKA